MAVAGVAAAMDRFFQYRDLEECCILKENVSTGGNGYVEYVEWNLMSPVLFKTYTSFENELATNGVGVLLINIYHWMQNNPWFPVFALGIYGALIVAGKKYFKDRNPWKLRKTLALWNFSLSLFSLCGVFRLLPQVLYFTTHLPLKESVCGDVEFYYGRGSSGLWVQLFVLSKFPELLDTFFIIVHKKPLIFLHWYHHVTVLLYCWSAYVMHSPSGAIFAVMNYSVHSIMYGYYFLMAIKIKPKWFNPIIITLAQICQMIAGVTITFLNLYFYLFSEAGTCGHVTLKLILAGCSMYGSYLFLFMQFFRGRYKFMDSGSKKGKLKFF
mmetsp:Transcript_2815/g.2828  ORF Transcript_2815/g.2828 Transcript_2815/m.2828 type:complete len:326 (-) Transcript_2815:172-1149(-)